MLVMTSAAFDFVGAAAAGRKARRSPARRSGLGGGVDSAGWRRAARSGRAQRRLPGPGGAAAPDRRGARRRSRSAAIVTTGKGIDPADVPAPANVQVVRVGSARARSCARRSWSSRIAATARRSRRWPPACRSSACRWAATSSTSPPVWCTPAPACGWTSRRRRRRSPRQFARSWETRLPRSCGANRARDRGGDGERSRSRRDRGRGRRKGFARGGDGVGGAPGAGSVGSES